MTTERDLDWRLASWLDDAATPTVPDTLLARSLARVEATRQRPGWLVRDRGRSPGAATGQVPAWRRRRLAVSFAVAVIVVVLGAGLLGNLFPAILVGPSGEPSIGPTPSASGGQAGQLIAYVGFVDVPNTDHHCDPPFSGDPVPVVCPLPRVWIVGADGSGAHELQPGGRGTQSSVFWSPDGEQLLYEEGGKLFVSDLAGGEPRVADTGCVAPCIADFAFALSTDGAKLLFTRGGTGGSVVIAKMDLATGRVAELSATEGAADRPRWSPDGRRIVFTVGGGKDNGGPDAPKPGAAFVVDADGQNLYQVSPPTLSVSGAAWSPDGARLLLAASNDVYTIRPDGTDQRQLTTDGISIGASWTPDGRILFVRGSALFAMDADGANAIQLVAGPVAQAALAGYGGPAWQPAGGPAIVPLPWSPTQGTPVGPPPPTPPATPLPDLSPGFSWTGSLGIVPDENGGDQGTRLGDGRVLIILPCTSTAELYDPATGAFSPTGGMTARRLGQTLTLLRDGRVLVTGGANCGSSEGIGASAELFDPATGTFSAVGSMRSPREDHTATLLPDGRVLVAGGTTGTSAVAARGVTLASIRTVAAPPEALKTAELFDPATGTFSPTGSMTTARASHTATALLDGRVLFVGAGDVYPSDTSAELYDPGTGTFHRTGSMTIGRFRHTSTLLRDGRVLITGGVDFDTSFSYASAELYDPGDGTFSSAGLMHTARQGHTATGLLDGRVLIAGGWDNDSQGWQVLSDTELFDPATGAFTVIGPMGDARTGHTATLLIDGRVLIAGGSYFDNAGSTNVTSAVLYLP